MPPRPHHPDGHPHPPHHAHRGHHGPHPHHAHQVLDALELMVRRNLARTIQELADAAEQELESDLARFIRDRMREEDDPALVLAAARAEMDLLADRGRRRLLRDVEDLRVGLVAPLPPHVFDDFIDLPNVSILVPEGHDIPHHLRRLKREAVHGTRSARHAAGELDAVVFEAFREDGHWQIDPEVFDIVDTRILKPEARRIIHLRPHRHPGDSRIRLDAFGGVTLL